MLSPSDFPESADTPRRADIDTLIAGLCQNYKLAAYLLCEWLPQDATIEALGGWPVPVEPFRGSDKIHLDTLLHDCAKFPKAHCHAIGHLGMPNILHRHRSEIQGVSRTWFIPLKIGRSYYIFFGFPGAGSSEKNISEKFVSDLVTLIEAKHAAHLAATTSQRMEALERYVKEIGHDIASAVQATVAKLRNVSNGLIPNEFIPSKVLEAEQEIMAAYRVADGLGLVIDPDYQIREFEEFDIVDVCSRALDFHFSEAQQRHVQFDFRHKEREMLLVGDAQAFEQMIGHLLSNAVKYAFGGSQVNVNITCDTEYSMIKVINLGIPLPGGLDHSKIWDFGYRGKDALARHVNGSGIGLFTVKKIALAHQGTITATHEPQSKMTTFAARFPLASYLRKNRPEIFIDGMAKMKGR